MSVKELRAVANGPRPGEVLYKQWVLIMAMAEGVSASAIYTRAWKGRMATPPLRRVNARVIWVRVQP